MGALSRITALDLRSDEIIRLETKAAVSAPVNGTMVPSVYSMFLQSQEITPRLAWLLYENVAPLAKVVNMIAGNVAGLKPKLMIDGQPAGNQKPFDDFMARPGFNRTLRRFIHELTVQELVSGTGYLATYGQIDRDPVALDIMHTQMVTPVTVGGDMWPGTYFYSEGGRSNRFERSGDRDFRWTAGEMAELTPIYTMDGNRRGVGLPRLSAIRADVELRMKGTEHNSSIMDRGARPSALVNFKNGMTPEQASDMGQKINTSLAGSQNAGKMIVTGGGEIQFNQLSMSPKDMDWSSLVKHTEDAIASNYNVPSTLFSTEAQTQNNYEVAWHQFYDQAVLPAFDVVWSGIASMFSARLGLNISVEHDALSNNILARQASSRAVELYGRGLVTRNEGRVMIGSEPYVGGDLFFGEMPALPGGDEADDFDSGGGTPKLDGPKNDNEKKPAQISQADDKPTASKTVMFR
jgi:HK97 family phage portal protein